MNTPLRIRLLSLCVAGCLTIPSTLAFAAGDTQAAQKYYRQASQAYQQGDYAKAVDLLERAYAYDADLMYKYNEILALKAMGKYDQALKILDVYEDPLLKDAKNRFSDIKELHAEIARDKAAADAAQAKPETKASQVPTKPVMPSEQPEIAGNSPTPADSDYTVLGWSLVGVGAAGLAAAGLFGSTVFVGDVADRRSCAQDSSVNQCYSDFDDPKAQYEDDRDAWSTNQTLTWVSLGVGVAAAVGGGVILYLDDNEAPEPTAGSGDAAALRVVPYINGDGAGGVLNLSF